MKEIKNRFQENVDIVIFGTDSRAPEFASIECNFAYRNFGRISPETGACVLNELDIFVDFSTYQAMGLTAMEAMACGCAVIVPQQGGATSFAVHDVNSLVIDTSTQQACLDALLRLVRDQELRHRMQTNAISSITQFFPELPALKILDALFSRNGTSRAS
jgi:glycosyltransferase involved in cell wall biosynthesis